MVGLVWVIAKKTFSLALILNSLVTLACIAQIVFNNYRDFPYWHPYSPYLINGSVFFLVIACAVLNLFPCATLGRGLRTGRFFFHHYVYGFFVLVFGVIFVVAFTSVSLLSLFVVYDSNLVVNAGRFFVLAGLTLFLDDLPDVSRRVESGLSWLKSVVYRGRFVVFWVQLFVGVATFYAFLALGLWTMHNTYVLVPASFTVASFFVTSVTSFVCVGRRFWLKIDTIK